LIEREKLAVEFLDTPDRLLQVRHGRIRQAGHGSRRCKGDRIGKTDLYSDEQKQAAEQAGLAGHQAKTA
jgi:hypothetical protein